MPRPAWPLRTCAAGARRARGPQVHGAARRGAQLPKL